MLVDTGENPNGWGSSMPGRQKESGKGEKIIIPLGRNYSFLYVYFTTTNSFQNTGKRVMETLLDWLSGKPIKAPYF